jgi:hypothetical protein
MTALPPAAPLRGYAFVELAVAADAAAPVERLLIAMGVRHAGQPERSRCSSGATATHASSSTTTAAGRRPRVAAIAVESARRRALDPERGVPHPLGGAQRPAPRDRRQGLPPLRRRRPQPHLQPHRAVRRPRAGDHRLDRGARLEIRGSVPVGLVKTSRQGGRHDAEHVARIARCAARASTDASSRAAAVAPLKAERLTSCGDGRAGTLPRRWCGVATAAPQRLLGGDGGA